MIFLWIVTTASLIAAVVSWSRARRIAKQLEQLSQMYWELKYEQGELRVRMDRQSGQAADPAEPQTPVSTARPTEMFVPLASLKR
jgi:hypothetical protein